MQTTARWSCGAPRNVTIAASASPRSAHQMRSNHGRRRSCSRSACEALPARRPALRTAAGKVAGEWATCRSHGVVQHGGQRASRHSTAARRFAVSACRATSWKSAAKTPRSVVRKAFAGCLRLPASARPKRKPHRRQKTTTSRKPDHGTLPLHLSREQNSVFVHHA